MQPDIKNLESEQIQFGTGHEENTENVNKAMEPIEDFEPGDSEEESQKQEPPMDEQTYFEEDDIKMEEEGNDPHANPDDERDGNKGNQFSLPDETSDVTPYVIPAEPSIGKPQATDDEDDLD